MNLKFNKLFVYIWFVGMRIKKVEEQQRLKLNFTFWFLAVLFKVIVWYFENLILKKV